MIRYMIRCLWCYVRGGHAYGDVMRWQAESYKMCARCGWIREVKR